MSDKRPTVSPDLIAALIELTPDRVRSRLDRMPNAAAEWSWQATESAWSVDTGAETVTLPHGHVVRVQQLACTCLLSPKCFHVLACVTALEVTIVEAVPAEGSDDVEPPAPDSDDDDDRLEPDEKQRRSASELVRSVAQLLQVGVANAGLVVQSGLLRAVHQCRADGLHRLANLGLRIVTGTGEFRSRAPTSDPAQLADDVADLLETGCHILGESPIAGFWIGTARRKQLAVRPRRLHGLFAEPIVTRSGFAGAAAYFLGEDDRIYTASEVRPGDVALARDAYLGGIEIGSMIQPAKQLARTLYFGTDLTASADGRLGRGKGIKIAEQGRSSWRAEAIEARFRRSLLDQWNAVYAQASLPADVRRAGWDFVFLGGIVIGAAGPELLLSSETTEPTIRIAIENEGDMLYYRENLRMLSHAPGLRLKLIGRMSLQDPTVVSALAVAPVEGDSRSEDEPRFELPESLADRICLGFDEIQRHYLVGARPSAVVLNAPELEHKTENPLAPLERRWIATMLSGLGSQRAGHAKLLAAEVTGLNGQGFATGAALLETLSSAPPDTGSSGIDTFLAIAVYLRICSDALARARELSGC